MVIANSNLQNIGVEYFLFAQDSLRWLRFLIYTGTIDSQLFWVPTSTSDSNGVERTGRIHLWFEFDTDENFGIEICGVKNNCDNRKSKQWNLVKHKLDVENFSEQIEINSERRFVILQIRIITNKNLKWHANVVVVDRKFKTLELFEPLGYSSLNKLKQNFFKTIFIPQFFCGYQFVGPLDFCPYFGPQRFDSHGRNYCLGYCLLYIQARIMFPQITQKQIVSRMLVGTIEIKRQRMEKFVSVVDKIVPPISSCEKCKQFDQWLLDARIKFELIKTVSEYTTTLKSIFD